MLFHVPHRKGSTAALAECRRRTLSAGRAPVAAHALPPITLKGIAREVVPYEVEGIYDLPDDNLTTINEVDNGLTIFLDTTKLDGEAAERARRLLEKAIAALRNKGLRGETDHQPTSG